MIADTTIPYDLSESCRGAYEKIKALILTIFSIFKARNSEKNLKEEFRDSYVDFARKLDEECHCRE